MKESSKATLPNKDSEECFLQDTRANNTLTNDDARRGEGGPPSALPELLLRAKEAAENSDSRRISTSIELRCNDEPVASKAVNMHASKILL